MPTMLCHSAKESGSSQRPTSRRGSCGSRAVGTATASVPRCFSPWVNSWPRTRTPCPDLTHFLLLPSQIAYTLHQAFLSRFLCHSLPSEEVLMKVPAIIACSILCLVIGLGVGGLCGILLGPSMPPWLGG